MIKLHNVSKTFNNKDDILKPISLEIEDKKILGIVGENGAGKTTLIKIMTGLVIPSSGTVFMIMNYYVIKHSERYIEKFQLF